MYVSLLCLAWFLLGILVGRRRPFDNKPLRRRPGGKRGAQRPKRRGVRAELYVGNLPYDIDEAEIRKVFSEFGQVRGIRVIENRSNGKSKGYGFVEMADEESASRAAKALSKRKLRGRRLIVNEAKTKAR